MADIQLLILLALGIAAVGMQGFALVDAVRQPEAAFVAAGKRTKTLWLVILAVSLGVGIVTMRNVVFTVGWLAVLGPAVYLADVRPALNSLRGRRY